MIFMNNYCPFSFFSREDQEYLSISKCFLRVLEIISNICILLYNRYISTLISLLKAAWLVAFFTQKSHFEAFILNLPLCTYILSAPWLLANKNMYMKEAWHLIIRLRYCYNDMKKIFKVLAVCQVRQVGKHKCSFMQ